MHTVKKVRRMILNSHALCVHEDHTTQHFLQCASLELSACIIINHVTVGSA